MAASRTSRFLIIGFLSIPLYPQAQEANGAPSGQESRPDVSAQPKADPVSSPPTFIEFVGRIVSALEAIAAKDDPPEKTERENSDLRAQWKQAKWAAWMVGVGIEICGFKDIAQLYEVPPGHRLRTSDQISADKQINEIRETLPPVEFEAEIIHTPEDERMLVQKIKIPYAQCLVFRVVIQYRGPFSKGHETAGYWRYDKYTDAFQRHGGEEHNYFR